MHLDKKVQRRLERWLKGGPIAVTGIDVVQLGPENWRVWRDIRLRSLSADRDAFASTYEREAAFDEETWRSRVDAETGPALVACAGDVPVGIGAGWLDEPGRMMVVAMWTDPSWRGRGVGSTVLEHLSEWAGQRGLQPHLWVADANPAARRLYESHGFRGDGRSQPLRQGSVLTMSHLVLATRPDA